MSLILGIILTLIILLIVVMVHELGHFMTARWTGMRVEEFGIGIPPKAATLGHDKKGTEYTLNWLPLGGFVRIYGENPGDVSEKQKNTFISKSWPARVLVLSAGVIMNFILAFVILSGMFLTEQKPLGILPMGGANDSELILTYDQAIDKGYLTYSGVLLYPLTGSIAEVSGIKPGDQIIDIGGVVVDSLDDISKTISRGGQIPITLSRSGVADPVRLIVEPRDGKIGVALHPNNLKPNDAYILPARSLPDAVVSGAKETVALTKLTWKLLGNMTVGLFAPKSPEEHQAAKEMVAGPVGMSSMMSSMVDVGLDWRILLIVIATISINLGIINILPFPALDGGRIVTTTLYSLASYIPGGKKYVTKLEGWVHMIGFVLLILLMIYITGLDITRFFK